MKRAAVPLLLILSSITLAAQNGPRPQASPDAATPQPFQMQPPAVSSHPKFLLQNPLPAQWQPSLTLDSEFSSCPVSLHASQGIWNHTVAVKKGLGDQKSGQRILLTLKDSPTSVVTATIRVRGLNGTNHMLKTPVTTSESWNASRTINITFVDQGGNTAQGDLWIPGFTSVTSIQLLAVSYANGSTWKSSSSNACRVQPDPMMLITER
jgi:hypothetical protein